MTKRPKAPAAVQACDAVGNTGIARLPNDLPFVFEAPHKKYAGAYASSAKAICLLPRGPQVQELRRGWGEGGTHVHVEQIEVSRRGRRGLGVVVGAVVARTLIGH